MLAISETPSYHHLQWELVTNVCGCVRRGTEAPHMADVQN